jgi:hypothetical protein
MLQEISNIDKHRLLMVGAAAYVYASYDRDIFKQHTISDFIAFYGRMIEPEAVVLTFTSIPHNPANKVNVEFYPNLEIVFKRGESVKGKNIIETMNEICSYVAINVINPLSKFL